MLSSRDRRLCRCGRRSCWSIFRRSLFAFIRCRELGGVTQHISDMNIHYMRSYMLLLLHSFIAGFLLMLCGVIVSNIVSVHSALFGFQPDFRRSDVDAQPPKHFASKMPFFVRQKVQICPKLCHKFRILPVFCRPKKRPFQQCITVAAVKLFYEVLPKQFEAFGFYFSQCKQVTAEYWVS